MNYAKFQKFSHVLGILFNVLFWVILISGIIASAGFIYIIINYENLPNMVEELKYITPDDVSEFLKYSKGYLIMCLIEFVVATGLEAWLYKTISNTSKSFERSDCVFTIQNYKNMKKLASVFYCMALSSIAIVSLATLTLSENEANLFYIDETSLCLGLVFTFICFLFKQTARPVVRTIEITQVEEEKASPNPPANENKEQTVKEDKPKQAESSLKKNSKNLTTDSKNKTKTKK